MADWRPRDPPLPPATAQFAAYPEHPEEWFERSVMKFLGPILTELQRRNPQQHLKLIRDHRFEGTGGNDAMHCNISLVAQTGLFGLRKTPVLTVDGYYNLSAPFAPILYIRVRTKEPAQNDCIAEYLIAQAITLRDKHYCDAIDISGLLKRSGSQVIR